MGKRRFRLAVLIFFVLFSVNFVSSAHYIAGYVEDAKDGESSNNKIAMLWNPVNGELDNLTGVIGVNGDSGSPNVYMFDCELLETSCQVGDELRVKIIDSGDGYLSNYSSIIVTGAYFDMLDNVSLNTPPVAGIISPLNEFITNKQNIEITCSFSDLDSGVGKLSLYYDNSGSWELFETKEVSSGVATFTKSFSSGNHKYGCYANDGLVGGFSENRTLIVDLMNPVVNFLNFNQSNFCGATALRVSCDVVDDVAIGQVLIEVNSPSISENRTATHFFADIYTLDLMVSEVGDWSFRCLAEDNATNMAYGALTSVYSYSGNAELSIDLEDITFSKVWPIEGEEITISANVTNSGCSDAVAFPVSFYEGNPLASGIKIGDDKVVTVQKFSSKIVEVLFSASIGWKNIFASLDSGNKIFEDFENNNVANNSFDVPAWQEFYGNISSVKVLASSAAQFGSWDNDSNVEGNVFMTDSESEIDWLSLTALGRKKSGGYSSNDFSEVDNLLSMENYFDSVALSYTSFVGRDFLIHQQNVLGVPSIQSTDNNNFVTGVLWDASDDTNDEFDSVEKEDLVFVSKVNRDTVGKYGTYDYEIRVPVKLREYDKANTEDIYFYYELV